MDIIILVTFSSPINEHPELESPQLTCDQVIWKGFVNMSGLAKFATTAYPVSGPAQNVNMVKGGCGQKQQCVESFAFLPAAAAGHSARDGAHCSCAGVGLHGQAEELHHKSNAHACTPWGHAEARPWGHAVSTSSLSLSHCHHQFKMQCTMALKELMVT